SFFRNVSARHAFDERRFAGTIVAQQGHDFAWVDIPVNAIDRGQTAETLSESADGQDRRVHRRATHRTRPTIKSRDWSISTATMTTVPTTMNCQKAWTLSITSPVVSTAIISAPMTVPMIVPAPPNRLTPPMITAAIDDSSSGSPTTAEP